MRGDILWFGHIYSPHSVFVVIGGNRRFFWFYFLTECYGYYLQVFFNIQSSMNYAWYTSNRFNIDASSTRSKKLFHFSNFFFYDLSNGKIVHRRIRKFRFKIYDFINIISMYFLLFSFQNYFRRRRFPQCY